ncbi:hypothetical protein RhiirC2_776560 [Rhizophagus irregularis]|uniref:Uncharacterized protein n=1 Tax=Rhizophagus irregularis TaxID=588596 RepID=A0A2N1NGJ8_9GLOM|nr:hypothetical protein RhiirC2_776560 [Rhizophagus irregularis]
MTMMKVNYLTIVKLIYPQQLTKPFPKYKKLIENEEIFNDCYSQVNNKFKYFINDDLNFESLINQRKLHEAYCSKPLERRFKPVGSNLNSSNNISIQPNKASNFVAYFTKNENPE